jgi:uncharacterized membrane protein
MHVKEKFKKNPESSLYNNPEIDRDIESNKYYAALSYVFVLFLIPLLLKRSSKFTQFHARQGLIIFMFEIIVGWIVFFGQIILLSMMTISIVGIVRALNGEWWKIPYIYQWSKKIKL